MTMNVAKHLNALNDPFLERSHCKLNLCMEVRYYISAYHAVDSTDSTGMYHTVWATLVCVVHFLNFLNLKTFFVFSF